MKMSAKEREFHRKVATYCFNHAWDLLDKKNRIPADDSELLNLAHASRYHWGLVGTPTNIAVGEWQLSRIYAELGHPRLALTHAKSCLATCKENKLSEIEHTANEAMARAYAVAKDYQRTRKHLREARRQLDRLKIGKDDREIYQHQLNETEALIP
jgi:hypothetical protein